MSEAIGKPHHDFGRCIACAACAVACDTRAIRIFVDEGDAQFPTLGKGAQRAPILRADHAFDPARGEVTVVDIGALVRVRGVEAVLRLPDDVRARRKGKERQDQEREDRGNVSNFHREFRLRQESADSSAESAAPVR